MKIYESGENYLETILVLKNKNGTVRSVDVAAELNFSKPSISRAMKVLVSKGYITLNENHEILFTKQGEALARNILEKHTVLSKYFALLGVPEQIAKDDACKVEHVLSNETYNAIKNQLCLLEKNLLK